MIMMSNFLYSLTNCFVKVSFLTKLVTLGISFSTVVKTLVVVATLVIVILGISPLTSFILAVRVV